MANRPSLSEIAKWIRFIDAAYPVCQNGDGNARWEMLQTAKTEFPALDNTVQEYIYQSPSKVLEIILAKTGIDESILFLIDSKGQIRKKAELIIQTIQTLYKERKKQDA